MSHRIARLRAGLLAILSATTLTAAAPEPRPAPDFTLQLLDGTTVGLADLKGKLVILNFWATWCVPCRRELKDLDALATRAGGRIAIYAVDVDGGASERLVAAQARTLRIPIALRLTNGRADYHPIASAVPSTFVISSDRRIVLAKAGALMPDELERTVSNYLPEIR